MKNHQDFNPELCLTTSAIKAKGFDTNLTTFPKDFGKDAEVLEKKLIAEISIIAKSFFNTDTEQWEVWTK